MSENKDFLKEISKIKHLERGVAVNNRNKFKRFRKKWHRIENQVPQAIIRIKPKKSTFYELVMNLKRERGCSKDFGGIVGGFYSFLY